MALTSSTMLALGTELPKFNLTDTHGNAVSDGDFKDAQGMLVMFICNHCPFVKHIRNGLAAFGREYREKGLGIVAISSNDAEAFPDDGPEKMKDEVREIGYVFPYLYDATQQVAKDFGAACTPDFFLFDRDRRLVYRGQFDRSRPDNGVPVTGTDLRAAADAVLEGKPVSEDQVPSLGCNIKWKDGNEPDYAK